MQIIVLHVRVVHLKNEVKKLFENQLITNGSINDDGGGPAKGLAGEDKLTTKFVIDPGPHNAFVEFDGNVGD